MTDQERQEVKREALLRALTIVQRYQDENWRRLRVNDICFDLKRLISEELRDDVSSSREAIS